MSTGPYNNTRQLTAQTLWFYSVKKFISKQNKKLQIARHWSKQTYCPHWIQENLCFDLQELGSVHWLCSQPAYCSKTEARVIVWNKRIQNCKQDKFVPHKSGCITTKSGLYAADMVTKSTSTTLLLHSKQWTANSSFTHNFNECTCLVSATWKFLNTTVIKCNS